VDLGSSVARSTVEPVRLEPGRSAGISGISGLRVASLDGTSSRSLVSWASQIFRRNLPSSFGFTLENTGTITGACDGTG